MYCYTTARLFTNLFMSLEVETGCSRDVSRGGKVAVAYCDFAHRGPRRRVVHRKRWTRVLGTIREFEGKKGVEERSLALSFIFSWLMHMAPTYNNRSNT